MEINSKTRAMLYAFKGVKYPYIPPFQHVMLDGVLYFHFTDYGKKMKLIEKDKHARASQSNK